MSKITTVEDIVKIVEEISESGFKARLAYVAKQDEWVLEVDDPKRILSKATFTSDTPQKACEGYLGLLGVPEREIRRLRCYVVSSLLQPDGCLYSLKIQKKSWRELHEHDSWLILKSHITATGGLAIAWQDGDLEEKAMNNEIAKVDMNKVDQINVTMKGDPPIDQLVEGLRCGVEFDLKLGNKATYFTITDLSVKTVLDAAGLGDIHEKVERIEVALMLTDAKVKE